MFSIQHAHESQACGAIELTRVEEDRRDLHLSLELLEQRRSSVERKERPRPGDEDHVNQRVCVLRELLGTQLPM